MSEETTTDMGFGLGVLFGLAAVLSAVGMYLGAPDELAAWAFAAATVFGVLSVVAIHAYS